MNGMRVFNVLFALAVVAFCAGSAGAAPKFQFDVAPPGRIVQDTLAYLTGEGMNSAWHVVASRTLAGRQLGKDAVYQWYLSFYAPSAKGLKLMYRLPNAQGELLSRVTKAHGDDMYFPMQDVKIVGTGEFERAGIQDVVVWDHQTGADCGEADVTVFGANTKGRIEQRVHAQNGCSLDANIVRRGALSAVRLTGPYYGPSAPLCCPTKPRANALLSYGNGRWSMAPEYYTISASLAAHR